jgi:hypothetical protein
MAADAEFLMLLSNCSNSVELSLDPAACSDLAALYDTILQQNLLRIVELYSVVEIEYVAKQVGQGRQDVDAKFFFIS